MGFKLVISDPKTKYSGQKEVSEEGLVGKKIGEKVSGSIAGLDGYELEITGGSDKEGFPMRSDIEGTVRKKVLLSGPPGFHSDIKGLRKRKSVRGNTISSDIVQINAKIVKYGSKPFDQIFVKKDKEAKKPEKSEGKATEEKPKEGSEHKHKEEKK